MTLVRTRPRFAARRPLFDSFFDRPIRDDAPLFERETLEAAWMPDADVSETEKEYVVQVEVPGIPKENLDVTLDGNVLTLSGWREVRKDEETEKYICREREEGRFVRSLRLPTAVVEDKIKAVVDDGVMTVR